MHKLSAILLGMLALNAQANVIQYFAGLSYNNPSELFKIKDYTALIGGTGSYAILRFDGTVLNFNTNQYDLGIGHSSTYTLMPYGRVAKRINDKMVFAVDVTEPFNSNLDWGTDTFTRWAVTQNFLTDVDVSPKLSYALSKKLQIGGGLNFNFLKTNEVNFALPTGQTTSANLINHSSSFGLGFNVGATYIINETNFLGATYYSNIKQNTNGYSALGNLYSNTFFFNFTMPATTSLSYLHIFNPKWLANFQIFQSQWNVNKYARLFNTAAPAPFTDFTFTMNFRRSYVFIAAARNQFAEKLGLTFVAMVDTGPERNEYRTLVFPSDDQYFVGMVGDYHFSAKTSIELLLGHVFSNTSMQNHVKVQTNVVPFTTGRVQIDAHVVDLKFKIEA